MRLTSPRNVFATQKGRYTMRRHQSQGRTVSKELCVYRLAANGKEIEIEVEVTGTVMPYWAGNYDNPPEGGEVEDIEALFQDGKKQRDIPLTDEEVRLFSEELALLNSEDFDDREYDRDDDREYDRDD